MQDRVVVGLAVTLFSMSDPIVCRQCGARNPPGAEWCGQCFASLRDRPVAGQGASLDGDPTEVQPATQTAGVREAPPTGNDEQEESDPAPSPKSGTWVCSVCEVFNSLELERCSACGTSIFASFGAAVDEQVRVDPQKALLRSLMFPGLGHAYARQGLLGSAIGGLVLMSLGFGIGLAATGVRSFGLPLILLAFAVWVAAGFDAFRIAGGQTTSTVLLRPRVVTALVGSVVVQLILAAFLRGRT
ncbi:MAG: hypothetical protein OEY62_04745 [Acidimicrobiia bacterium]|nr:hypothetical protein [Acidimicrobiia bacterium]